jgi:hypothetical protein
MLPDVDLQLVTIENQRSPSLYELEGKLTSSAHLE